MLSNAGVRLSRSTSRRWSTEENRPIVRLPSATRMMSPQGSRQAGGKLGIPTNQLQQRWGSAPVVRGPSPSVVFADRPIDGLLVRLVWMSAASLLALDLIGESKIFYF